MAVKIVIDWLKVDAAVIAIVADRIRPVVADGLDDMPLVTVRRLSADPVNTLVGPAGLVRNSVIVDCWALTYAGALALRDAVRACLSGHGVIEEHESEDFGAVAREFIARQYLISLQWEVWSST